MATPRVKEYVTPERSLAQRRAALVAANIVRTNKVTVKRELELMSIAFEDAFEDPRAARLKVEPALRALPTIGRKKALRIMAVANVSHSRTMSGVTVEQRGRLLKALDSVAPAYHRYLNSHRKDTTT